MQCIEKIAPLYTVYYYTDFLFRVVKFKRSSGGVRLLDDAKEAPMDRFEQSYCRSRSMVLQLALCNHWDYFVTITVDPDRFDRMDLDSIYKYLSQWIRDYRKKHGCRFAYLLVPELHADGRTWHFHGFFSGLPVYALRKFVHGRHPEKLIQAGFLNFPDLGSAVGFCSLSALRDPVATAFYVVKYITKEHAHDDFYQHLYFCSRGLSRARPVSDCYVYNPDLEGVLTHESDFCATGWCHPDSWLYPLDLANCEPRDLVNLSPVDLSPVELFELALVDSVEVFEQISLFMKNELPDPDSSPNFYFVQFLQFPQIACFASSLLMVHKIQNSGQAISNQNGCDLR